jgi:salicylate hydroxylase
LALDLAVDRSPNAADTRPILIAGAGIAGLAAAIALAGVGRHVRVLESRASSNEEGAGIQIGPNGVHALRQLGVADRLQRRTLQPTAIAVMAGPTGNCLARLPLMPHMQVSHGAPYWVTRRSDLHQALLSTARTLPAIEIAHGFRVDVIEGAEPNGAGGVRVRGQNGRRMEGAALVGADGLWSTVARTWLRAPPLHFSNRTAARALIPLAGLPPPFNEPVTGIWMGGHAHLVHYPVAGDLSEGGAPPVLNLVLVTAGGIQEDTWGTPAEAADLLPALDGWPEVVRHLVARTTGWRRWPLMQRAQLDIWCDGPVTVVGDAAHPVLPFLAQGAVLALEDAVTLGNAVAATPQGLDKAFRVYAAARQSRARKVQLASRRNGQVYHLTGPPALARNAALGWLPTQRLLAGYDWLYGYRCPDFTGASI